MKIIYYQQHTYDSILIQDRKADLRVDTEVRDMSRSCWNSRRAILL